VEIEDILIDEAETTDAPAVEDAADIPARIREELDSLEWEILTALRDAFYRYSLEDVEKAIARRGILEGWQEAPFSAKRGHTSRTYAKTLLRQHPGDAIGGIRPG
jgi:hypothetical protein